MQTDCIPTRLTPPGGAATWLHSRQTSMIACKLALLLLGRRARVHPIVRWSDSGPDRRSSWLDGRCLKSGDANREEEPVTGPHGLKGREATSARIKKCWDFVIKKWAGPRPASGRSPCCRPATDQPPLVGCPRATRPQPRSSDGATEGPSADGGYDGSESASRQANSREKADFAQRGTHFAETQLFRRGTHFAEKVVPSEAVTDTSPTRR